MIRPDEAVCSEFCTTEEPEPVMVRVGEFPKLEPVVVTRQWWRRARVQCVKCRWKGWTTAWRISGPSEPRPLASEITEKVAEIECPSCGTAKGVTHGEDEEEEGQAQEGPEGEAGHSAGG